MPLCPAPRPAWSTSRDREQVAPAIRRPNPTRREGLAEAVSVAGLAHARQHAITATADHTSTATSGQMLKADANGLPVDATNPDAAVAAAVTASHAAVTLAATADVLLGLTGQGLSLDTQTATYVLAGPTSGAAAAPTFRALAGADLSFIVNAEKGKIIELVFALVPVANIMGFWIFDETGATTTIVDRGTKAHDITLGSNASALTPTVVGLCPSLLFANASATEWSVADHDDFSFGNAGVDTPWSTVTMCNLSDMTNSTLLAKFLSAGNQKEWQVTFDGSDKLCVWVLNPSGSKYLEAYYDTALTGDQGSTHVYASTASGGAGGIQAIAGLNLYRDGVQLALATATGGVYDGMTNGTGALSNSQALAANGTRGRILVQLLVNIELSAATVLRLSNLFRAYAGIDI